MSLNIFVEGFIALPPLYLNVIFSVNFFHLDLTCGQTSVIDEQDINVHDPSM